MVCATAEVPGVRVIEPQDLDADPICGPTPTIDEPEPVLSVPRWEPDNQMVAAVLASPKAWRGMTQLCDWDRAWLVAGLTLGGMTAWEIAERLGCSLRLVRSIRAEDRTQACVSAQQENRALTDDLRLERSEHGLTRRELADASAQLDRLQRQLDYFIDAHLQGLKNFQLCPKNHPLVGYNMYVHDGRRKCRECNRTRVAEFREAKKQASEQACNPPGITVIHPSVVGSAV